MGCLDAQGFAQVAQIFHHQMRMGAVRGLQRGRVAQPDGLHSRLRSPDHIGRMVVAHVQHLVRRATQMRSGGMKNPGIGFGHTGIAGADAA